MPIVSLSGASVVEEDFNDNFLSFTVTLSEAPIDTVSMNFRLLDNGTANDTDLRDGLTSSANNGTVVFGPGQTTATISVRVDADTRDERDEAVTLELYNLSLGSSFQGGGATLTAFGVIRDDDGAGSNLAVFVSDPTVVEDDAGNGFARFEIRLSQPAPSALTLAYETVNGTASSGNDFVGMSGPLTFAPGQDVTYLDIPIIGGTTAEFAETFSLVV